MIKCIVVFYSQHKSEWCMLNPHCLLLSIQLKKKKSKKKNKKKSKAMKEEKDLLQKAVTLILGYCALNTILSPSGGVDSDGGIRLRKSGWLGGFGMLTELAFCLSLGNVCYMHKELTDEESTKEVKKTILRSRLNVSWCLLWLCVGLVLSSFVCGIFLHLVPDVPWIRYVTVALAVTKLVVSPSTLFITKIRRKAQQILDACRGWLQGPSECDVRDEVNL